jgi:hypothetical protein
MLGSLWALGVGGSFVAIPRLTAGEQRAALNADGAASWNFAKVERQ